MWNFDLLSILLIIPGIIAGITFHEYAHALTADKLGDKTPRFQGRLTLNPISHIDPIGLIMILIAHFGWGKPVETNPRAFKNYYKDDLKVSLAGPVANLILALAFAILEPLFLYIAGPLKLSGNLTDIIYSMLNQGIWMNCMLFIFNLIPLPGLDGFHILRDLAPKFFYNISDFIYRYQFIILILFILVLSRIVIIPVSALSAVFQSIASLIYHLISGS